ncbi:hypothetical protein [Methylocella sp.]|uniref:hypothetical protein n=1 Tax=Methylocella sp. TaxID=1978226 RepID=UPI003784CE69
MRPIRLDLTAIQDALAELPAACAAFPDRDELSPTVVERLLLGYAYVDDLLGREIDILQIGASRHWLELNHIALCGPRTERGGIFSRHIDETERRFYDDSLGGIGERMEWLKRHGGGAPETVAAGLFLQIVSAPQLFVEGNTRTATLIASFALAARGRPPLVLTPGTAAAYFPIVDACADAARGDWRGAIGRSRLAGRLERFLRETADPGFLLDADAACRPMRGGSL